MLLFLFPNSFPFFSRFLFLSKLDFIFRILDLVNLNASTQLGNFRHFSASQSNCCFVHFLLFLVCFLVRQSKFSLQLLFILLPLKPRKLLFVPPLVCFISWCFIQPLVPILECFGQPNDSTHCNLSSLLVRTNFCPIYFCCTLQSASHMVGSVMVVYLAKLYSIQEVGFPSCFLRLSPAIDGFCFFCGLLNGSVFSWCALLGCLFPWCV